MSLDEEVKSLSPQHLNLKCNDGAVVQVPKSSIRLSRYLQNVMHHDENAELVPIPWASQPVKSVAKYLAIHDQFADVVKPLPKPLCVNSIRLAVEHEEDADLVESLTMMELVDLLKVSDWFQIDGLRELSAATIGLFLRQRTPEELIQLLQQ